MNGNPSPRPSDLYAASLMQEISESGSIDGGDRDGDVEKAITGYEGAAEALRHYGRETTHAVGYDRKAAE